MKFVYKKTKWEKFGGPLVEKPCFSDYNNRHCYILFSIATFSNRTKRCHHSWKVSEPNFNSFLPYYYYCLLFTHGKEVIFFLIYTKLISDQIFNIKMFWNIYIFMFNCFYLDLTKTILKLALTLHLFVCPVRQIIITNTFYLLLKKLFIIKTFLW